MKRVAPEGRTAVFIDGANSYATTKQLGFTIDYNKLRSWLDEEYAPILRISYYTCINDEALEKTMRPLLDWLEYNGYTVHTKKGKVFSDDGRYRTKNGIDIDMAIDIVQTAQHVDNIVVFSGDANMVKPVKVAKTSGCHVTVVSSRFTQPPSIADELRRAADEFIDYKEIGNLLESRAELAAG